MKYIRSIILTPLTLSVCILMGCMRTSYDGLTDLHAIYRIIKENHPGVYNEEDPTFNAHLESAYHAHAVLLNNQPQKEQQTIITNFIKTFNDNHLAVSWRNTQAIKTLHTQKLFSITEIAPHTLWITLPTFYNLSTEQSECFNTIIQTVSTATTGHTIIFDIRTNGGGSSYYGDHIVDTLFGAEYAKEQRNKATAQESVDWRASAHNIEYLTAVTKTLPQDQQAGLKNIIEGMQAALAADSSFYHQSTHPQVSCTTATHTVTSNIIVIIDQSNGSAALDFLDSLTMMEYPITLIGQTTSADRLYMEVHPIELPSKTGSVWIPIKVYRNRFRGDTVPYTPHIPYDGDMTDTEALQKFMLTKLSQTTR